MLSSYQFGYLVLEGSIDSLKYIQENMKVQMRRRNGYRKFHFVHKSL